MVQHDLDGNLQFLHRTYLGKFDPASTEPWRELDFVTNPLTPQQAVVYAQAYGFFPHQVSTDFEKHCCPNGTHTQDASQCDIRDCQSPGDPLPVLAIPLLNLDHSVRTVVKALHELFTKLQSSASIKSS